MTLPPDPWYKGPRTFREFDFSPFDANAWLEERFAGPGPDRTPRNHRQRELTQRQYTRLSAHPEYLDMVTLLRRYIDTVILEPQTTERDWWVVTSVPATGKRRGYRRLSCLSIQWIEMMLLSERLIDDEWTLDGFINVPLQVGERWYETVPDDLREQTRIRDSWYKYSGMLARIEFNGLTTFARLMDDPDLMEGSEALAFRMMQKGTTPYARFHDFNLADDIFGREKPLLEIGSNEETVDSE